MADSVNHSDSEYFKSYGCLGVHELMIKDKPRTEAYKEFLEKNYRLIKEKIVLDVGAGSGILSLFAARSGAKKVYAVEASGAATVCQEIVNRNRYENVISVIHGRIEDIELPEKVDVIISEWMGFYLLHESMLDSVLFARDKWLKSDGIILPSHAAIYVCPVNMSEFCKEKFEFWEDVYGFDFTPFQEQNVAAHLQQPAVTTLKETQLLSSAQCLVKYDLKIVCLSDVQEIEEKKTFTITQGSILHGFAAWFDVIFSPGVCTKSNIVLKQGDGDITNGDTKDINLIGCEDVKDNSSHTELDNRLESEFIDKDTVLKDVNSVTLDTSPFAPETHWKQTVCFLPVTIAVEKDETIFCKFSLCQGDENKRHYNISLQMLESLEDTDEELETDDDDFDEDVSRHPMPCDCGAGRCRIISALMEKYDQEQSELEIEAEFVDVSAEVQAAHSLDKESSGLEPESPAVDE
ncbi:protein arginine N-methyltransferase 6-like [Dreissena polymorpha]|uniref:type I protein arginine methyltransferase n=1 Tax=Dreissena polymorpha TaxID=45954 RepID=A0A9D4BU46_DREPO|nr:protein arginine N-methyltransferase 6-like [Dreissena polymorpha]XP_052249402.1 protein arginine N-methyltransferase 6-like [Dreissena polymorpha]KAH3709700.1 hypothetical protein DPMN_069163 [Dreissena polymorpha]